MGTLLRCSASWQHSPTLRTGVNLLHSLGGDPTHLKGCELTQVFLAQVAHKLDWVPSNGPKTRHRQLSCSASCLLQASTPCMHEEAPMSADARPTVSSCAQSLQGMRIGIACLINQDFLDDEGGHCLGQLAAHLHGLQA